MTSKILVQNKVWRERKSHLYIAQCEPNADWLKLSLTSRKWLAQALSYWLREEVKITRKSRGGKVW